MKRLAVSLVLKDARAENSARLQLIDAYIDGKYFQQAKDHCTTLKNISDPRWQAEAALRETKIICLCSEISPRNFRPVLDHLEIYENYFGANEEWCKLALKISDLMSEPSPDRDFLLQKISDVSEDEATAIAAMKILAGRSDNPEIKKRAISDLFRLQPTVDLALKVSLAFVETKNFRAALETLRSVDQQDDERILKAIKAVQLKL